MAVRIASDADGKVGIIFRPQVLDQVARVLESLSLADGVAADHEQVPVAHVDELVHLRLGDVVTGQMRNRGTVRHYFGGHLEHRCVSEALVLQIIVGDPGQRAKNRRQSTEVEVEVLARNQLDRVAQPFGRCPSLDDLLQVPTVLVAVHHFCCHCCCC